MKCVGSYYYELTLAECDEGNAETTASLMEDAWKNQQQSCQAQHSATAAGGSGAAAGGGTSGVASACSALASRVHSACSVPSTSHVSVHALHTLDQPSCSRVASACSCACAAAALAMTPPPHAPSQTSISVQTDAADNQIAVANV